MGGIVKSVFGEPDMPQAPAVPPPPPPPPSKETADNAVATQNAKDEARRRRGAAATVLTGPEGVGSTPVATKSLLGS